jgi:hypothetical protein
MEKQWATMDKSFKEIQKQTTPIEDGAKAASNAASAAQQSANVARDALIRGQRAFVSFEQRWDNGVINDEAGQHVAMWEFRPWLINNGDTPTRDARHRINWAAQLPVNFNDVLDNTASILFGLAPKERKTGANLQIPVPILNMVRAHTLHLFLWGWARYHDVFRNTPEHISMFCTEIMEVRSDPAVINTPLNYLGGQCSPRHNCVDEECDGEPYGDGQVWRAAKK